MTSWLGMGCASLNPSYKVKIGAAFFLGALSYLGPALAGGVQISEIFGTWVTEFPSDRPIVAEFTGNSISVYAEPRSDVPPQPHNVAMATYRVLGDTILISLQDGHEITALMKGRDALILDFDGAETYRLRRTVKHPI